MPKYEIRGHKRVYFTTIVDGESETDVLLSVGESPRIWISECNANVSDGTDLQIMGKPKEL